MTPGDNMAAYLGPRSTPQNKAAENILSALDGLFGLHPGFRAVHAKGLMCSGTFRPTGEAASLSRAPHLNRPSVPVSARLSDFAGVPTVTDNDLSVSGPRGFAVRFHLGEHHHTDIIHHPA